MKKSSILLLGAGGHARACIDVIECRGEFFIEGLVGMPEELNAKHLGYPVIAADCDLPELCKNHKNLLIAVGHINSPDQRMRLYSLATELGFSLPVIIAPTAHVSHHATIGAGSIVMHGAIVNAGAKIGANCIINTKALIEHDVHVGDHCHISTGVVLNGNTSVGTGSFVGSCSVVREGISIGNYCIVGMGLSVRHQQIDHARYMGEMNYD